MVETLLRTDLCVIKSEILSIARTVIQGTYKQVTWQMNVMYPFNESEMHAVLIWCLIFIHLTSLTHVTFNPFATMYHD